MFKIIAGWLKDIKASFQFQKRRADQNSIILFLSTARADPDSNPSDCFHLKENQK